VDPLPGDAYLGVPPGVQGAGQEAGEPPANAAASRTQAAEPAGAVTPSLLPQSEPSAQPAVAAPAGEPAAAAPNEPIFATQELIAEAVAAEGVVATNVVSPVVGAEPAATMVVFASGPPGHGLHGTAGRGAERTDSWIAEAGGGRRWDGESGPHSSDPGGGECGSIRRADAIPTRMPGGGPGDRAHVVSGQTVDQGHPSGGRGSDSLSTPVLRERGSVRLPTRDIDHRGPFIVVLPESISLGAQVTRSGMGSLSLAIRSSVSHRRGARGTQRSRGGGGKSAVFRGPEGWLNRKRDRPGNGRTGRVSVA
jgi:hypothetical protein